MVDSVTPFGKRKRKTRRRRFKCGSMFIHRKRKKKQTRLDSMGYSKVATLFALVYCIIIWSPWFGTTPRFKDVDHRRYISRILDNAAINEGSSISPAQITQSNDLHTSKYTHSIQSRGEYYISRPVIFGNLPKFKEVNHTPGYHTTDLTCA